MKPIAITSVKSPLILFALFIVFSASQKLIAQIIYTDIKPDFTSTKIRDSYYLDLNNDDKIDFIIFSLDWSEDESPSYMLEITPQNSSNAYYSVSPWYTHIFPANKGYTISINEDNTDAIWWNSESGLFAFTCFGGGADCNYNWTKTEDKYLCLKFKINNEIHYGWARMSITDETHWVIKDYAYNAVANEKILAGAFTLDTTNDTLLKDLKISVLDSCITVNNLKELCDFQLYSVTGQKITSGLVSEKDNKIQLNPISKGLYILELKNAKGYTLKKKLILT